jgi:hypothetical protein
MERLVDNFSQAIFAKSYPQVCRIVHIKISGQKLKIFLLNYILKPANPRPSVPYYYY